MTKIYRAYFKNFFSPTRTGGFFLDYDTAVKTVTEARDKYVAGIKPNASSVNIQSQAEDACVVYVDEIIIGRIAQL